MSNVSSFYNCQHNKMIFDDIRACGSEMLELVATLRKDLNKKPTVLKPMFLKRKLLYRHEKWTDIKKHHILEVFQNLIPPFIAPLARVPFALHLLGKKSHSMQGHGNWGRHGQLLWSQESHGSASFGGCRIVLDENQILFLVPVQKGPVLGVLYMRGVWCQSFLIGKKAREWYHPCVLLETLRT